MGVVVDYSLTYGFSALALPCGFLAVAKVHLQLRKPNPPLSLIGISKYVFSNFTIVALLPAVDTLPEQPLPSVGLDGVPALTESIRSLGGLSIAQFHPGAQADESARNSLLACRVDIISVVFIDANNVLTLDLPSLSQSLLNNASLVGPYYPDLLFPAPPNVWTVIRKLPSAGASVPSRIILALRNGLGGLIYSPTMAGSLPQVNVRPNKRWDKWAGIVDGWAWSWAFYGEDGHSSKLLKPRATWFCVWIGLAWALYEGIRWLVVRILVRLGERRRWERSGRIRL